MRRYLYYNVDQLDYTFYFSDDDSSTIAIRLQHAKSWDSSETNEDTYWVDEVVWSHNDLDGVRGALVELLNEGTVHHIDASNVSYADLAETDLYEAIAKSERSGCIVYDSVKPALSAILLFATEGDLSQLGGKVFETIRSDVDRIARDTEAVGAGDSLAGVVLDRAIRGAGCMAAEGALT